MSDVLLSKPWRKSKYFSLGLPTKEALKQRLKDDIINYKPLDDLMPPLHRFPQVNILLFGAVGGGKSSAFNTISSVFKGKIFNIARRGRSVQSVTTKLTKFQVMYGGIAEQLRLTLWDSRGIEDGHLMTTENMRYLLEGKLPDRYPLDPSQEISSQSPQLVRRPGLQELVHCVATVVDASTADDMDIEVQDNIRKMQTVMNAMDVPHIILLTNIDKISELTAKDATNAFKSENVHDSVEKISDVFGLPRNAIFVMKCYEEECYLDDNVDIMALIALKGILDYCDAFLYRVYDDVKVVASKAATMEEENKSLKSEQLELQSINREFEKQNRIGRAKIEKLQSSIDEVIQRVPGTNVKIMQEYELLKKDVNTRETDIDRLREQTNRLKEEISNVSRKE